jgi:predicted anti-sigma-YlaC factor YlaD
MAVRCHEVWELISEYVDGELGPVRVQSFEEHVSGCVRCRAVVEGTRNVVRLYRDERMMPLPAALRSGIRRRLAFRIEPQRGSAWGWAVGLAAGGALALAMFSAGLPNMGVSDGLSAMSQPAVGSLPAQVALVRTGKLFHVLECPYMHGQVILLDTAEAIREGYAPCPRCMGQYLPHPLGATSGNDASADNIEDGVW